MNDDYDNAKTDKAILEKLTMDRDDDECSCALVKSGERGVSPSIEYCRLHEAAPRLLALLKRLYAACEDDYGTELGEQVRALIAEVEP